MTAELTARDKIIEAAYKVMAEQGYAATTISAIASEAGVARGLLHYYFKNKEEILVEVLKELSRRYTLRMRQLSQELPATDLSRAAISDAQKRLDRERERFLLRFELFALALRNPTLRAGAGELMESGRVSIANAIQRATEGRERSPEALAAVILACLDGLALQQLMDPTFDASSAYDRLYELVSGL
ncbi:MAG TPA: TetR family transcriptional regulator [Ktedonobacterales bacterium]|nr:TetR family transcriptional regulator [Ktedonobacterales bacterium]